MIAEFSAENHSVLNDLLQRHRARLKNVVRLRMDRQLKRRVDPSDIIQEAYVEATKRMESFVANQKVSFFLWMRTLVIQSLLTAHRKHVTSQKRQVSREVAIAPWRTVEASSVMIAERLAGNFSSPSHIASKEEQRQIVEETLNSMDSLDREIIAMRHFEKLTRKEIAQSLEIAESTVSRRYLIAIDQLKKQLEK